MRNVHVRTVHEWMMMFRAVKRAVAKRSAAKCKKDLKIKYVLSR